MWVLFQLEINTLIPQAVYQEWATRQLIIWIFSFISLFLIPQLLQLDLSWQNKKLKVHYYLSHHPESLRDLHELKIGKTYICSGCVGSFIGLMIGEVFIISYLLFPVVFSSLPSFFILFCALLQILVGFSRYFTNLSPKYRLFQHGSLFSGLAFTVVGIDLLFQSVISLLLLFPCLLVTLGARLLLAKRDHVKGI